MPEAAGESFGRRAGDVTLLTEPEAAAALKITAYRLATLRREGRGPAFVRIGRAFRYRPSDLDAWACQQAQK